MMLSERAQELIAQQRARYIESMPAKKQAIMRCIAEFNPSTQDGKPEWYDDLFQQVHRLAGSAGSFGLDSLGQAASVVDHHMSTRSFESGDPAELLSVLQKLLAEIDEVIRSQTT